MPLRSVKMKRFILGFQRRVWCPKWTPLSSSWRMVTTATVVTPRCVLVVPALAVAAPAWRPDVGLLAWRTPRRRSVAGTRAAAAPPDGGEGARGRPRRVVAGCRVYADGPRAA